MKNIEPVIDKLNRIHELWAQLRQAKFGTPEYNKLVAEIRIRSAEYQAVVTSADGPLRVD